MRFRDYLRLVTCVMLIAVLSLLLARRADAGRFTNLVAVAIVTVDGEVIPVTPVTVKATPARPLIRAATAPVKLVRRTVCGPDGCVEVVEPVSPPVPAGCPCDCPDCTCNTTTQLPAEGEQHSIVVANANAIYRGDEAFMQRGPIRRLFARVATGMKNFAANRPKLLRCRR